MNPWKALAVMVVATGLSAPVSQGAIIIDLIPSANPGPSGIAGAPGQTVGWGFDITNTNLGQWLVVTSWAYFPNTPGIGLFTDFTGFHKVVVGPTPSQQVIQLFNLATNSGVGSYAISGAAAPGTIETGVLEISYDLYSSDPNLPGATLISSGLFLDLTTSVTVVNLPEPGTAAVTALALVGLLFRRARPS